MKKLEILKISFILRSDKKNAGSSPVMMQLYLSGRRAYLGTGYKANFDEWDFTLGKFKSTSKKYQSLNELLDRIKMDAINIYNLMRSANEDVTVAELRDRLSGKDALRTHLIAQRYIFILGSNLCLIASKINIYGTIFDFN